jgi:hypothetical protein
MIGRFKTKRHFYPVTDYSDQQITATSRSHGRGLERLRALAQENQTVSYRDDQFHITANGVERSFDTEAEARRFLESQ